MRLHKIENGRYVIYGKDYTWQLRLEISNTYNFGFGWKVTKDEQDVTLSLYCWRLFSLYITLNNRRFKYRSEPIATGITWDTKQHILHIQLLDQTEMDSSKPAVIDWYRNYRDWLFGKATYSESSRNSRLGGLPTSGIMKMPEGDYKMKLEFYTSYWHRPRSPFVKSLHRVEITPEKPVPIPGKGESSWDLDEDATYSSTMPVKDRTTDELIADFKKSIMDRRERYGGKNWLPEEYRKFAPNTNPKEKI